MIEVNLNQAYELVLDVIKARKVPMLHSSPGIGKSDLAKKVANKFNLMLIDLRLSQCDPSDLMGFPFLNEDKTKAGYVPMDFFPTEGTPLPEGYKGWLVLLDEFNSAPLSVQAAAYKIILDRMVGQNNLHKRAVCMAAGNLQIDAAIVNRLSTASQSRLVHLIIKADSEAWLDWATIEAEIDHRIVSFIRFRPDLLHKFDPNHNDMTFACPRTWEFTSDIIKPYPDAIPHKKLPVLAGTVGEGAGREFLEFTHIYGKLPTKDEILADPENIKMPSEPSTLYALSGMVSTFLNEQTAPKLMQFISRLPVEFQFHSLSSVIKKNTELQQVPAIRDWTFKQAKDLM